MKRADKRIAIGVLICGSLLTAVHYIEREATIGLASGELRQLYFAWRVYASENGGKSPRSLAELVDAKFLEPDVFDYNGKPRCRALAFPELVYEGLLTSDEPEEGAVLARQRWSDSIELVLYADGNVIRQRP